VSLSPDQLQQVRIALLLQADAASERGLTHKAYLIGVKAAGHHVTAEDITKELLYLADKGLLKGEDPLVSPEMTRIRITAQGRDFLAKENF